MSSHNRFLLLILVAIVLGAFLGGQFPAQAVHVQFLGDIFLNALKMIVVPLVVASMIIGVTNLGDIRKLGGIGRRTVVYYMATTGIDVSAIWGGSPEVAGVSISPVLYTRIFPENAVIIAALALLATLLSGLYPAWHAGRVVPVDSIRLV